MVMAAGMHTLLMNSGRAQGLIAVESGRGPQTTHPRRAQIGQHEDGSIIRRSGSLNSFVMVMFELIVLMMPLPCSSAR